ncbi:MAG: methyl-accepting chemotaxis protein [Pseudomonadota bacterium]|nr:methyl-accepting chemotaxis protein [Pseudomonadota bacterium]
MKGLVRLSIVNLTLLCIGLIGGLMLVMTGIAVNKSLTQLHQAELETRIVELVDTVEKIAHNHAVERGLTAGFLGSGSEQARAKVLDQRQKAKASVDALRQLANQDWPDSLNIRHQLSNLFAMLDNKEAIQQQVDRREGREAFGYYSKVNRMALDTANTLVLNIANSDVSNTIAHALTYAWLKERLGQLRGKINGVLASQVITPQLADDLAEYHDSIDYLITVQKNALNGQELADFNAVSGSSQKAFMDKVYRALIAESVDFSQLPAATDWFGQATAQIGLVKGLLDDTWLAVKATAEAEYQAELTSLIVLVSVTGGVFAVVILLVVSLVKTLNSQLSALTLRLNDISRSGDLTINVTLNSDNELGIISRAVNQTLLAIRDLITGLAKSVSTSTRLGDSVAESAETIHSESEQTQQRAMSIATAIEQMTQTSKEIAQSAFKTLESSQALDKLADEATQANNTIKTSIHNLTVQMQDVENSAKTMGEHLSEISGILDTINTLSDQTNLLALNAAIEAARAGEHGRGFAVVADEVRQLATASRGSSDKISSLLDTLAQVSNTVINGVSQSAEAARTSLNLTEKGERTASTVRDSAGNVEIQANAMSAAAEQQSVTSDQIAKDVVAVQDAATHQVSIADELKALTTDLQSNNALLERTMANFKY